MQPVVTFENISKQYRLGLVGRTTLKEDITRCLCRMTGKPDPTLTIAQENLLSRAPSSHIWALKNINLKIHDGEVLGIVGKNGAGKSTLLKLLARVTGPTTGTITIRGRVSSLLEVGTGFHPELTGRENIYLNGAIHGMRTREIRSKLDEIIEFAMVSKYIDTPVKRYSSGMRVRLAFAVAAHLEPEILVVDEVLAVGDAEFQRKAIGKMQEVSKKDGRTILFVSHNMALVSSLSDSGILLENGEITYKSDIDSVVETYLDKYVQQQERIELGRRTDRTGSGLISFSNIHLSSENGQGRLYSGKRAFITVEYKNSSETELKNARFAITVNDSRKNRIFTLSSRQCPDFVFKNRPDQKITCEIPFLPLAPGKYIIDLWAGTGPAAADRIENAVSFEVLPFDVFKSGFLPNNAKHGPVLVEHRWY